MQVDKMMIIRMVCNKKGRSTLPFCVFCSAVLFFNSFQHNRKFIFFIYNQQQERASGV